MSKNVYLRPGYTKYSLYIQRNIHRLNQQNTLRHILDIQDIPLSITLIININDKCVLS